MCYKLVEFLMIVKILYVLNVIIYVKRVFFYLFLIFLLLVFRFNLRKRGLLIGFRGILYLNEVWFYLVFIEVFIFRILLNYVFFVIFSGELINFFGLMWDVCLCVGINILY